MNTLTFYLDPRCPWAWRTSLWVREVQRQGLITVQWKLLSLNEINRDAEKTANPEPMNPALRTLLLARERGGQEAIDRLYLALGRARHDRQEDLSSMGTIEAALEEAKLERGLAQQAIDNPSTAQRVLEEHRDAVTLYGAFGVPWLVLDDNSFGFFGPVIDEIQDAETARTLWEHISWLLTQPAFYEMKRSR